MDVQESNIELNLQTDCTPSSPHSKLHRSSGKDRQHRTAPQQSSWKQQRQVASRNSKLSTENAKDSTGGVQRPSQADSQRGGQNRSRQGHTVSGSKTIISSMFKNNPDIPIVHVDGVKSGREEVFSSKAFSDLPLHPHMIDNLEKNFKFTQMTSVQQQAIPVILSGQDALVKSQTGSGKTLAYGVPIVQNMQKLSHKVQRSDGPLVLVLVPTRELVLQSLNALQKLLKPFMWIVPGFVMGGERKKSEKARIRRGINVLVATPGRIVDHLQNTECLSLRNVQWLVLDEADRLLDMGFDKEIAIILNTLNKQSTSKQTILLSATLTDDVERLAGIALKNPKLIDIAQNMSRTSEGKQLQELSKKLEPSIESELNATDVDERTKNTVPGETEDNTGLSLEQVSRSEFTLPDSLQQHFVIVPSKLRLATLVAFILWRCIGSGSGKMLVFLSSCDSVEFHYALIQHILKVSSHHDTLHIHRLHGSMSQEDRTAVFVKFSEAKTGMLLCTDVAARGLDLPKVRWIVQYNTPGQPSDYVHRVGRTARIGKKGHGLLFLTPSEVDYVHVLSALKISLTEVTLHDIWSTLLSSEVPALLAEQSRRRNPHTIEDAAIAVQHSCENFVLQSKDTLAMAKTAFRSFVRAYATYPTSLKHIFHVKKLHLGHVAKSFALRETPSNMGRVLGKQSAGSKGVKRKRPGEGKTTKSASRVKAILSEFSSGLDSGTLVATKKRRIAPSVGSKKRGKSQAGVKPVKKK